MTNKMENRQRAMLVGERLRQMREAHGWTLRDLERVSRGKLVAQMMSRIESGQTVRISLDIAVTIATTYGMSPNDVAEMFGVWNPAGKQVRRYQHPALDDASRAAMTLDPDLAEKLMTWVQFATGLVMDEQRKREHEDEASEPVSPFAPGLRR